MKSQAGRDSNYEDERKYIQVEIRPGVFHSVPREYVSSPAGKERVRPGSAPAQRGTAGIAAPRALHAAANPGAPQNSTPGQQRQPLHSPARAQSALPGHRPHQPAGRAALPQQLSTASSKDAVLEVAGLEHRMRAALRSRCAVHNTEKMILNKAIAKVVLGSELSKPGIHDFMNPSQFQAVWRSLSVDLNQQHISALFSKYGTDSKGRLQVLAFIDTMLKGSSRQIMSDNDNVQRGAYVAGQPALHTGKIQYPECKKGVWPPTDWDPRTAVRSAQVPDARLQLEFVYGYDGFQATSPNLFTTAKGDVVYFAAAVGIVYSKATHTQKLFLGHDDDILSLAIHPDKTTVATGQVGKDPCVIIWDTVTMKPLQKLHQGYGNRGVQAVSFSGDGNYLAAVCTDNPHTMYIWDWRRSKVLMERRTAPGAPPTTYGVVWSPFHPERLVTYGQNHIKFYELLGRSTAARGAGGGGTSAWECKQDAGTFSGPTFTVFSACFLPSGIVLSGAADGSIVSWKGNRMVKQTPGHAPGPIDRRPDGVVSYGGVRVLLLTHNNTVLVSGGADGQVIKWDVSKGELGAQLQRIPIMRPDQMGSVPPSVRGLDCLPNSDIMVAGTSWCDVLEVDDTPEILVQGQQAALYSVSTNPAYPHVFATACDSDIVIVWSAATRKPIRVIQLSGASSKGDTARSCAFSPDGQHLAVGMIKGGIRVLEFHPQLAQVYWGQVFTDSVSVLQYSPCGRYLAAGSHDQQVVILDARSGYRRISTSLIKHSSTVQHLDWSSDSTTVQSNDQAREVLYTNAMTGQQMPGTHRDTSWSTWTCVLGFPVMGIWHPDSDGSDINACDRSPSCKYVVTADDLGRVCLFNYPAVVQNAPALRYGGHSSHVMNVRWAKDESLVVSAGGRDRCVFQWKFIPSVTSPSKHDRNVHPMIAVDRQGIVYRL